MCYSDLIDEFFSTITIYINNKNDEGLFNYLSENYDFKISQDDIAKFLLSLTCPVPFNNCFSLSGSGGSGLNKPNITSICCLYLASYGVPIIKIGSHSKRGGHGSTDFFSEIGFVNKSYLTPEFKFAYFDIDCFSPWRRFSHILSINQSFLKFFKECVIHDVRTEAKMVGVLGADAANVYCQKKQYNCPNKVSVIYSITERGPIDEIVPSQAWLNGVQINNEQLQFEEMDVDNIIENNYNLIEGKCKSNYWKESLFLTFSYSLNIFKPEFSLNHCYDIVNEMYKSHAVLEFIKLLRK